MFLIEKEMGFVDKKAKSSLDNPGLSYMGDNDFPIFLKDFISENLLSLLEDLGLAIYVKGVLNER